MRSGMVNNLPGATTRTRCWSRTDTTKGFNRIANYSFSVGLTTRFYGMYYFKKKDSNVKAIRHIINPSISFGYTPDFTTNSQYFQKMVDPKDSAKSSFIKTDIRVLCMVVQQREEADQSALD